MHPIRYLLRLLLLLLFLCVEQRNGVEYQCDEKASCGCSSSTSISARIVGGESVSEGSWSWTVSIRYYGQHFCGGSIISPLFVITAAHCTEIITTLSPITILAGSTSLEVSSSNPYAQIRSIAQISKHPNYQSSPVINDIALFRLSTPLDFTAGYIKPICLPAGTAPQPPNHIDMIAVGWGDTYDGTNSGSPVLRQVTLKSIDDNSIYCQQMITNTQVQFCAGILEGGKGSNFNSFFFSFHFSSFL